MPGFRRVDMKQAGASAMGILVPPGARTLVIVRPRSLPWDLLPAFWDGDGTHAPAFCVFGRDEAVRVAKAFLFALESAVRANCNPVQTLGADECFQMWIRTEAHVWIACHRSPGESYRPAKFASQADATVAAESLTRVVWPSQDVFQDYYFNTQQLDTSVQ